MNSELRASIEARQIYLAAIRRHEVTLRRGPGYDYELAGIISRLVHAVKDEAVRP